MHLNQAYQGYLTEVVFELYQPSPHLIYIHEKQGNLAYSASTFLDRLLSGITRKQAIKNLTGQSQVSSSYVTDQLIKMLNKKLD
ncbi:hypothetical protein EDB42_11631 [Vibrio crassostreae]|nr:hypothetical protein EDB42_11631 [Vibrio crassostreae]TCT72261.1 hypothetical protein EDB41_11631 [Vibrio crassostreae]